MIIYGREGLFEVVFGEEGSSTVLGFEEGLEFGLV